MELSKTFDPKAAEEHWFQLWVDRGYFKADPKRSGEVFSIVIPPPNVTGQLHLGHALNVTLHDVIVRMRRMQGYNTLWLPGTDHAGIATQNVVEREIAKEKITRHDLGRERFVERVWQWRDTYGGKILHQLRKLGASCDWSRERFTLDEGLSRAVTKVFVMLYDQDLIYRGRRMINWCPRCETALSDLEVEHKESQGNLWYVKYPFADGEGSITVATTRPETMLGDTAVAVNMDDDRYRGYLDLKTDRGRDLLLPLVGRRIPLIAYEGVDRNFGTGALKITPAHDPFDLVVGQIFKLDAISVIDPKGRMSLDAGKYAGLTREAARKKIVEDLEALGLIEKIEPHKHAVGVCSRCDTRVEPMISEQWFMRMREMAAAAENAVRAGKTAFHPKRWENTFFSWLSDIHDWCISRQLWWGHRIPAYWCQKCDQPEPIVAEERPISCPRCGSSDLKQDDDVLDTWFSSGLWPFSTLGWPEQTEDLKKYYPTSLLITGFDIIFFWVARMMMFGIKCMDDVPFRHVYITPLVRDQFGKKMTKSRGNVVDPLEIMDKYGTDAVRFTLAQLSVQGRDLILSDDRLAASRAFANKIWNAARFVLMNLEGAPQPLLPVDPSKMGLAERWILSRLDAAIAKVTGEINAYEFNNAALTVYQFIWHEFCDWYIELAKEPLKAGGERQAAARYVLVTCFDRMLRILHPFMPFISEEIWQALRPFLSEADLSDHLAVARFPVGGESPLRAEEAAAMDRCIETTEAINSLRSLAGHHPGQRVSAVLRYETNGGEDHLGDWRAYAITLGKVANLKVLPTSEARPQRMVFAPLNWAEIGVETPEAFDFEKARASVKKKLEEVRGHLERHQARFDNPGFRAKADAETVAEIAEKIEELKAQEKVLRAQLEQLQ